MSTIININIGGSPLLPDSGNRAFEYFPRSPVTVEDFDYQELRAFTSAYFAGLTPIPDQVFTRAKNCEKGQACGSSCISRLKVCRKRLGSWIQKQKAKKAQDKTTGTAWTDAKKEVGIGTRPSSIQSVIEIEKQIRPQRYESAVLFDESGNQVFFKDGAKDEVSFTYEELAKMKNGILTHNHPDGWDHPESNVRRGGNSFSDDDMDLAAAGDLREIRAISPRYLHSMTRPVGGWPDEKTVKIELTKAENNVRAYLQAQINVGDMSIDEATATHCHLKMKLFSQSVKASYSREEL
jgi:hypothetical protein